MTQDEELQALREENRSLKALIAQLLPLQEQLAQAHARIKELEDRLAQDSRTSSKPPSSDGLTRLPRRARRPSGKSPGGQAGHAGHTLALVEPPDTVVRQRPLVCKQCAADLSQVPGRVAERRQVLDVPEIRLLAQEHQIEALCCPSCQRTSMGSFPTAVSAPVQYGPHLRGARGTVWRPPRASHPARVERAGRRAAGADGRAHCRADCRQPAATWR